MSCWNKEQLENMLEDVVNALDLSDVAIETHGPLGTPPAELVRLVLAQKDATIKMLRAGMVDCTPIAVYISDKNGNLILDLPTEW
jgi:hypothetical protein